MPNIAPHASDSLHFGATVATLPSEKSSPPDWLRRRRLGIVHQGAAPASTPTKSRTKKGDDDRPPPWVIPIYNMHTTFVHFLPFPLFLRACSKEAIAQVRPLPSCCVERRLFAPLRRLECAILVIAARSYEGSGKTRVIRANYALSESKPNE